MTAPARATVPAWETLIRGRTGMYVAGAALAGFGVLFTAVKAGRSNAFDVALTLRIQGRRHPSVARAMEVVSWPGFPPQSRIIPPLLASTMFVAGLRTEAVFQLLAWGSAGISTVVKGYVHRPRPLPDQVNVVLVPLGGSSFPSGHVLTYVGTYGYAAFVIYSTVKPPLLRWPLTAGLVGLIALVGPSRIYLGHHWPTDVTASYLLGTTYLIGLLALYRRAKARQL